MVLNVSQVPVDLTPYTAQAQNIPCSELPKPLSKNERIHAICKTYQQLIALEKRRNENPFRLKVESKWTYVHHVNGDVITIITKSYHYISDFPLEDYQEEFERLIKQLKELETYKFMELSNDDLETSNTILILISKWNKLVQQNGDKFNQVMEEQEKLEAEDAKQGFKNKSLRINGYAAD